METKKVDFRWDFNFKTVQPENKEDEHLYIEGYASTFAEDRDGEVVEPDAFQEEDMKVFMMNPTVLVDHENRVRSVAGKIVDFSVDNIGLRVKAMISNAPDVESVRIKIKEGILKAFSIGGIFHFEGPRIKRVQLHEISIVPVPANQYSLFQLATKALKTEHLLDTKAEGIQESGPAEEAGQLDASPDEPKATGDPAPVVVDHESTEPQEEKAASGDTSLPLADRSRSWDADAAKKRLRAYASSDGSGDKDKMNWRTYRRFFFWYDAKNAEDFGSYKLPFADIINGKPHAIPRAVFAAAAAIQGARGGVHIPESDIPAVKSRIASYYKKLGETPPWSKEAESQQKEVSDMENQKHEVLEEKEEVKAEEAVDQKAVAAEEKAEKVSNETRRASKISFPTDNLREGNMDEANYALYRLIISGSKKLMDRYGHKVVWTGGVNQGAELVDSALSSRILEDMQELSVVRNLFEVINMPTAEYTLPIVNGDPTVYSALEYGHPNYQPTDRSNIRTDKVTFQAKKIRSIVEVSYEEGEDAIVPVLPIIRRRMARAFANAEERLFIRGNASSSDKTINAFNGILNTSGVGTVDFGSDTAGDLMKLEDINKARAMLGRWGWNPSDLRFIVGLEFYSEYLVTQEDMKHMDQVGPRATILTGQVGSVYGIPVFVSQGFEAPAQGDNNVSQKAILAHRDAVMIGDRRRLTLATVDHPADEYMELVGSERLDMKIPFTDAVVVMNMFYRPFGDSSGLEG